MVYIAALFFAVFAPQLAQSAPTTPLDQNALLQNGQVAQGLNTQFRTFRVTDNCTSGESACISGATANCTDSKWQTQDCLAGLQCFALPSVRDNGTFVACTSVKKAISIISASGATGGIFAKNNSINNSTSVDPNATSAISSDSSTIATVTVTGVSSDSAITQPSETTTLSPSEASSLLSSISANNAAGALATGSPSSSDTPSTVTTCTVVADPNNNVAASVPTTSATLTTVPSPTTTTTANSGPPAYY